VCRCRYQGNVSAFFSARLMISANHHQTGELTLSSAVWLKRNTGKTCDFPQPTFKVADHFLITACLLDRNERMDVRKFWPGNRQHLRSGIEFHRAGSQRYHGMNHRQILVLQTLDITEDFVLCMVPVEDRVCQKGIHPLQRLRQWLY